MEREAIIQIALKWLGTNEHDSNYSQLLSEMNKTPNVSLGSSTAWCAGFVSYCYNAAGLGDRVPLTTYCPTQRRSAQSMGIWVEWPSDKTEQFNIIRNIKPADILNWENPSNEQDSHTGLVLSVEIGSTIESCVIHTIEGNSSDLVKSNTLSYSFGKGSKPLAGFVCPELTGFGSSDSTLFLYSRDKTDLSSCLYLSMFKNISRYDSNSFELSCYMSGTGNGVIGQNTTGSSNNDCSWCALPDRTSYAQGRARELWTLFSNYNGFVINASELSDRYPTDGMGTYEYMCDSNKTYYSFSSEGIDESGKPINPKWSALESNVSNPFIEYGGDKLVGIPKKLMLKAVENEMNYEFLYKPNDSYQSSFSTTINESCIPTPGAIAVWSDGPVNGGTGVGYCGVVEKIKANGIVMISYSDFSGEFFSSDWMYPQAFAAGKSLYLKDDFSIDKSNRLKLSGVFFLGYIYPPSSAKYTSSQYQFTLTETGNTIKRIWVV